MNKGVAIAFGLILLVIVGSITMIHMTSRSQMKGAEDGKDIVWLNIGPPLSTVSCI